MSPTTTRLIVIAFFIAIVYNLGTAAYYMMKDKGSGKRMVWALTRRVGLSILLIALIALGMWTGYIKPHGIYG
jgi:hypothetical protein